MRRVFRWMKSSLRLLTGVSPMSLLVLLKGKRSFTRILSDTNRRFEESWDLCLPVITPQEITGIDRSVDVVLDRRRMSIGLEELIPLLELARLTGAKTALEIGTGSGGTTWHLAANLGSNGEVLTVDLPIQADENEYSPARIATVRPTASRLGCYFKDTPEAARISQLLMDSRELSSKDVGQEVDIVFIDGAHAYEYVKSDTELALSLLKPGGLVVWHDYFVFHPDYGVRRYLHNLAYSIPLYRLTDSICAVACVK